MMCYNNILNHIVGNAVLSVPSGVSRNLYADNSCIEPEFSDGTLGTAFPTIKWKEGVGIYGISTVISG